MTNPPHQQTTKSLSECTNSTSHCPFPTERRVSNWIKWTPVTKLFILPKTAQLEAVSSWKGINSSTEDCPQDRFCCSLLQLPPAVPARAIQCHSEGWSLPAFVHALLCSETFSLIAHYPQQLTPCISVYFNYTQSVTLTKKWPMVLLSNFTNTISIKVLNTSFTN